MVRARPHHRLSLERSSRFATLFRSAMRDCGYPTVYSVFLATAFSRATLDRWLTGRVRIRVSGAEKLINLLVEASARQDVIDALRQLLECDRGTSLEERFAAELRGRGLRVRSTLAALEAAKRFVPPHNTGQRAQYD